MKRHVKLCKGCVECLDDYFPYLYPNSAPITREDLVIEVVENNDCDNMECNMDREPVWSDN